jgi:DHA2 family multidrug resistance protein
MSAAPAGRATSSAAPARIYPVNPWAIAFTVTIATFMEALDTSVANVALPHIAGNLSASTDEATWVLTSYLVSNAIILPLAAWLSQVMGRKRFYMSCVALFTVSSFLCGLAPSLGALIFFRILQGAGGGGLQPSEQAILADTFPPEKLGMSFAIYGMAVVLAPSIGPTLGGWITDNYSWRWVFYINLPVGITSLVMTRLFIFDPSYIKQRVGRGIDYWGIGLLAVGIGALQFVLDKGQEDDWFSSNHIVLLSIVAGVCLVALIAHELTTKDPVVDLRVFNERSYAVGVFLMTVLGFVLYGSLVLLPIMLQTLLGYPPLQAGIAMAPRGVGSFVFMPFVGILTGHVDSRKLLFAGLVIGGATLIWLGQLNLQAGYWDIFWPQWTQGMAMGLLFVPLTTVTMAGIQREKMGNATSLFNLMRNLGGSVGIAATSTMLARDQVRVATVLGTNMTPYDVGTQSRLQMLTNAFTAAGADATTALHRAQAALMGEVHQQAAMVSFVHIFQLLGGMFVVLSPLVLLMRTPKGGGGPVAAH